MAPRRSGRKPQPRGNETLRAATSASSSRNTGRETPYFCLNCQRPGFTLDELDQDGKLAFLNALHIRRSMTWDELTLAKRHGLGTETLPASKLPGGVPEAFADRERFLVFRYHGNLPMVGARIDNVFHILWIERHYGELYDHGTS